MFWLSTVPETEETAIYVDHIDGIILGGGFCRWGEKHPMSWETIHQVVKTLYELFNEQGWVNSQTGSNISQVKEKFGVVRVYSSIEEPDKEAYIECFRKLIKKYPGIEEYLEPEQVMNEVVFIGPEEQAEAFLERNKDAKTVKEIT